MRCISSILSSAFILIMLSCGSSESDMPSDIPLDTVVLADPTTTSSEASSSKTKVKFEPFNNIDDVRQKLSGVGIGNLGRWRDDEMGGFMSITSYHEFGGGNLPNNLAYYLESNNSNCIKTLKLVLNINNGNKKPALSKFAEIIGKTYKALDLVPTNQIMTAAKSGKQVKIEKDAHVEKIELEKSRIETWKFIIETK